jgi:hypothetical protein
VKQKNCFSFYLFAADEDPLTVKYLAFYIGKYFFYKHFSFLNTTAFIIYFYEIEQDFFLADFYYSFLGLSFPTFPTKQQSNNHNAGEKQ